MSELKELTFSVTLSYDPETYEFLEQVAEAKGCAIEDAARSLLMFALNKGGMLQRDEPFSDFS